MVSEMTLLKNSIICLWFSVLFLYCPVPSHAASAAGDSWVDPTTGMEFVWVEKGCYKMGDASGIGWRRERPVHQVCIDGFYIGKYEVTQGQYEEITGETPSDNHSLFSDTDDYPVIRVSWSDAQRFIEELRRKSSLDYRLPSEAQWEFAARGRVEKFKFSGSDILAQVAWYRLNSDRNYDPETFNKKDKDGKPVDYFSTQEYRNRSKNSLIHKVGTKAPNGLGIYDMSGNVWEWCSDWYEEKYYKKSPRNNPQGPDSGSTRVLRGGSWNSMDWDARCSVRFNHEPNFKNSSVGFRLVLPGPKKK